MFDIVFLLCGLGLVLIGSMSLNAKKKEAATDNEEVKEETKEQGKKKRKGWSDKEYIGYGIALTIAAIVNLLL